MVLNKPLDTIPGLVIHCQTWQPGRCKMAYKGYIIGVRVNEAQKRLVKEKASRRRMTVSAWVLSKLGLWGVE